MACRRNITAALSFMFHSRTSKLSAGPAGHGVSPVMISHSPCSRNRTLSTSTVHALYAAPGPLHLGA